MSLPTAPPPRPTRPPATRPPATRRRPVVAALAALLVVGVLAGCGSGAAGAQKSSGGVSTNAAGADVAKPAAFDNATVGFVNKTSKAGGTLQLLTNGDCDSWDPGATYLGWCWNLQRLLSRTLVAYASVPGANNIKLTPDLATGLGQHNADFTQWTYHLRDGLQYQDGTPITSKDLKYAIERLFATDVISGGPTSYYTQLIAHPDGYAGVYKSGDLSTISTPDDRTITYTLSSSYADFDYLMTLPAAAPVPAGKEGGPNAFGATYGKHPVASGPYEIADYTQNEKITFVRNSKWSKSTDPVRTPLADRVVLTVDQDVDDIDRRLQAGQADLRADNGVQATFQSQVVTDPDLKKNADDPVQGYTSYLVVTPSVPPLDNVHCRRAVAYALNKSDLQRALGGSYGGDLANTMTAPLVPGYDPKADPYPTGADHTGDLTKAKAELSSCGQPNGFKVKEAYVPNGRGNAVFAATQQALARVGITVDSAPGDPSTYYTRYIGSPTNITQQGLGLAQANWAADFQSGYGFWNSIANGKTILPTGNTNYPSLNDPQVNAILDQVVKSSGNHAADFKKLDQLVMAQAVYLPFAYRKQLMYRNPRLTNVAIDFAYGGWYDVVNIGTSDGK